MKRFYSALSGIMLISMQLTQPVSAVNAQSGRDRDRIPPVAQQQQMKQPVGQTNRIIVKFKEDNDPLSREVQALAAESLSARLGTPLRHFRTLTDHAQVLELRGRLSLEEVQLLSERLKALPDVEYAEPDQIFHAALVPNDPQYSYQWHYSGHWGINAPNAWNITSGSASTVVAVLDTGITSHPDLNGRTVPGYDFVSYVPSGNDGNGRDSDPSDPGDWVTSTESTSGVFQGCAVTNSSWHGTHVAGTIAASGNNGLGVAGIDWKAKILPVRVLGKCGGYLSDIADGIRWAAGLPVSDVPANAHPAKVINVSIGGPNSCSATYQNAINAAVAAGTSVVVSAGNQSQDASLSQPGNCANVITVGATADDAWRASYSNYGAMVEISAPGGDFYYDAGILSTVNSGTTVPASPSYDYSQGTSMAAPQVAGVISLMLARNASLTPAQVLSILQSTATEFPNTVDNQSNCYGTTDCGAGIVNAFAAVSAVTPQTFADVASSYWAWNFIERLSSAGITGGCATGPIRYCPDATVSRAQMAVFLLRSRYGLSYSPPGVGVGTGFADVSPNYWAAAWIQQLVAEGITSGCAAGAYCPETPVTRAQMAVFLLRSKYGSSYSPPGVGVGTGFADVTPNYWAAVWIKQVVAEGISSGCAAGAYCPEAPVTRAEMAIFLARTFNLP